MQRFLILFFLIVLVKTVTAQEQVLVFINPEKAVLQTDDLKALQDLAVELDLTLKTININEGAPPEITLTPSIIFQNSDGRSTYYGRYKNVSRIKNFIRTARLAHQQASDNFKKDILLWRNEKAIITAPIKITNLTGNIPKDFDQAAFKKNAKILLADGMKKFKLLDNYNQSRSTRTMYVDLHPYLDATNHLIIKSEIYSQFNCVEPIIQYIDTPLNSGKWKDWKIIFTNIGHQVEQLIIEQINSSTIGDAFEPIPEKIATKSWQALDLALPEKETLNQNSAKQNITIPQDWTVEAPKENQSIIMFSFLTPLDNYAGEVKALSGKMSLDKNGGLKDAKGTFEVQIKDVTMGAEDFDYEVQNKMLQMLNFPNASFVFKNIEGGKQPLTLYKATEIQVEGTFTMLGIPLDLTVPATITPIINADENIRLQVHTTFQLPLFDTFKVAGPDGPSPAKDTLQFYMKFFLKKS